MKLPPVLAIAVAASVVACFSGPGHAIAADWQGVSGGESIRVCASEGRSVVSVSSSRGMVLSSPGTSTTRELSAGVTLYLAWDGNRVRTWTQAASGVAVGDAGSPSTVPDSGVSPTPPTFGLDDSSVQSEGGHQQATLASAREATGAGTLVPNLVSPSAIYDGPVVVRVRDGLLALQGVQYRGLLSISSVKAGLRVINELELEQYLYGVVPSEMYPSWQPEALKAQAVAARTYAERNLLRHAADGYNLCSTTHCQVYGGVKVEDPRTTAAVDATRGILATYGGRPIDAQFHSSSGGVTEDSRSVWGGGEPYLRSVESAEVGCPHSSWSVELRASDVAAKFAKAGLRLGDILDITPTALGSSGRISLAQVRGSAGSVEIRGERLRSILGLKSTLFYTVLLRPSGEDQGSGCGTPPQPTLVAPGYPRPGAPISSSSDGTAVGASASASVVMPFALLAAPTAFRFTGRGLGHGVGMSQWGAQAKAAQGYTYDQILRHYYPGIEVQKWEKT